MTTKAERTAMAIDLVVLVELMRRGTAAERSGNKVKAREYGRRRLALLGACDLQTQAKLLNWALYALAGLTRQKQGPRPPVPAHAWPEPGRAVRGRRALVMTTHRVATPTGGGKCSNGEVKRPSQSGGTHFWLQSQKLPKTEQP